MDSDEKKSLTIDYAFILAILTGALYLLSYLFFSGKFFYYNIPYYLIELNINNITHSIIYLSPFVILIAWVTTIALREPNIRRKDSKQEEGLSRKNKTKPRSRLFKTIIIIIIYLILFIVILLATLIINKSMFLGLLYGIITDILVFISILFYRKKRFVYLAILIYLVSSGISFIYGYTIASGAEKYIIVEENNKTFVSLTVYNDKFILAPFNTKTKTYTNEYKLMDMEDVKDFKPDNTGVIKLEKK